MDVLGVVGEERDDTKRETSTPPNPAVAARL